MRKPQRCLCLLWLGILTLALTVPPSFSPVSYPELSDDQPDPRKLLEQVVKDILTNPLLEGDRNFYGTPGDKRVALLKESSVAWPTHWQPDIDGYDIRYCSEQHPVEDFVYWYLPEGPRLTGLARAAQLRLLAIGLDKLNLQP